MTIHFQQNSNHHRHSVQKSVRFQCILLCFCLYSFCTDGSFDSIHISGQKQKIDGTEQESFRDKDVKDDDKSNESDSELTESSEASNITESGYFGLYYAGLIIVCNSV